MAGEIDRLADVSGSGSGAGSIGGGASLRDQDVGDIVGLIARAPWREAVTYRHSWPHEYVMARKDRQQALLGAFCARIAAGEGVECRFFDQRRRYLFVGEHKYWTMTHCADIDLEAENPGDGWQDVLSDHTAEDPLLRVRLDVGWWRFTTTAGEAPRR